MRLYFVVVLITIYSSSLFPQFSDDIKMYNQEINLNSEEVWELEEIGVLTYDQVLIILNIQKEKVGIHDYQQLLREGIDRSTINELRKCTYISKNEYSGKIKFNLGEEFLYRLRYGNKETKIFLTGNKFTLKRKYIQFGMGDFNVYYGDLINPLRDIYYRGYWANKELSIYPDMTVNGSPKEYFLIGGNKGRFSGILGTRPQEANQIQNSLCLLRFSEKNLFVELKSRVDFHSELSIKTCYYYGNLSLGIDWRRQRDGSVVNSLFGLYSMSKNLVWQAVIDRQGSFFRLNLKSYTRFDKYKLNASLILLEGFKIEDFILRSDIRWRENNYGIRVSTDIRNKYKSFQFNHKYILNSVANIKNVFGIRRTNDTYISVLGGMLGIKVNNFDFSLGLFVSNGSNNFHYGVYTNGYTEEINYLNLSSNSSLTRISGRYRCGDIELSVLQETSFQYGNLNKKFNVRLQYVF